MKIVFRFVNSLTVLLQAGDEDELSHYFTHLFDLACLIKYINAACYLNWFKLPIVAVHLQAALEPSSRVSVISVIIIVCYFASSRCCSMLLNINDHRLKYSELYFNI